VDFFLLLPITLVALWITKSRQQQRRITILARYLHGRDIEKHIETLAQGYSRALGEAEPARRCSWCPWAWSAGYTTKASTACSAWTGGTPTASMPRAGR
jgi:hypothetical protein